MDNKHSKLVISTNGGGKIQGLPYCNPAKKLYNMDRRPTALMQSPDGGKIPSRDAVRPSSPADICMYAETRSTKVRRINMKNKPAKLLALLLAAALLTACMAGCTGKTEQPAKAEATEKAEPAKDSTPADEEITLTSGTPTATRKKPSLKTWFCRCGRRLIRTSRSTRCARTAVSSTR